jgi:hypothetical protein
LLRWVHGSPAAPRELPQPAFVKAIWESVSNRAIEMLHFTEDIEAEQVADGVAQEPS